jgi:hypothetical protein
LLHQYTKNLLEKELDRNSDKGIAWLPPFTFI